MTIEAKLEQARRNLLELSTRNRLISMPVRRRRAKIIEIADERSDEVFRILVSEGQEMSFLPIAEDLEGTVDNAAIPRRRTASGILPRCWPL